MYHPDFFLRVLIPEIGNALAHIPHAEGPCARIFGFKSRSLNKKEVFPYLPVRAFGVFLFTRQASVLVQVK